MLNKLSKDELIKIIENTTISYLKVKDLAKRAFQLDSICQDDGIEIYECTELGCPAFSSTSLYKHENFYYNNDKAYVQHIFRCTGEMCEDAGLRSCCIVHLSNFIHTSDNDWLCSDCYPRQTNMGMDIDLCKITDCICQGYNDKAAVEYINLNPTKFLSARAYAVHEEAYDELERYSRLGV